MVARTHHIVTLFACLAGFDPRLAHVGFMVNKLSKWLDFLRVLWFSSVGVLPFTTNARQSLNSHLALTIYYLRG